MIKRFTGPRFIPLILLGSVSALFLSLIAILLTVFSNATVIERVFFALIVVYILMQGIYAVVMYSEYQKQKIESSLTTQYLDEFQDVLASNINIYLREEDLRTIGNHMAGMLNDPHDHPVCKEWHMWLSLPLDLAKGNRMGLPYFDLGDRETSGEGIQLVQPDIVSILKSQDPEFKNWDHTRKLGTDSILMFRHAVHDGAVAIAFCCERKIPDARLQVIRTALMQFVHYLLGLRTVIIESRRYRDMDSESYGRVISSAVHEISGELTTVRTTLVGIPDDNALTRIRQDMLSHKYPEVARWLDDLSGSLQTLPIVFRCIDQCTQTLEGVRMTRELMDTENAHLPLHTEQIRVFGFLEDFKASFRPAWPNVGINIRGDHDLAALGEPTQLRSIIRNLLTNAAEASPEDSDIDIQVSSKNNFAIITVSDEGIGVRKGNEDRIFDNFVTFAQGKLNGRKGHGIGLFLSRRMAREMGGDVYYDGKLNSETVDFPGARFTVKIPLAPDGMAGDGRNAI